MHLERDAFDTEHFADQGCEAGHRPALLPAEDGGQLVDLLIGCAVVVWVVYLLYVPWNAWWYLRFLLPTWPMTAIGAASILAMVYRSSPSAWRRRVLVAVVAIVGGLGVAQAVKRETFNAARGESFLH